MRHTKNAGWGCDLPKYDFNQGLLLHPFRHMRAHQRNKKAKLYRKSQARAALRAWIAAYATGDIAENPHTLNPWTKLRTGVGPI